MYTYTYAELNFYKSSEIHKWEDHPELDLLEINCAGADRTEMIHNRTQW
jgi:hypothetical protein